MGNVLEFNSCVEDIFNVQTSYDVFVNVVRIEDKPFLMIMCDCAKDIIAIDSLPSPGDVRDGIRNGLWNTEIIEWDRMDFDRIIFNGIDIDSNEYLYNSFSEVYEAVE